MSAKRLFTLVELLVVIAIISILAAMLMPALERARDSAKQTSCMSNLHGIGLALTMYADAYDGAMPTRISGTYQNSFWICTGGRPTYLGLLRAANLIDDKNALYCTDTVGGVNVETYTIGRSVSRFGIDTEMCSYAMQASNPGNPTDELASPRLYDWADKPITACARWIHPTVDGRYSLNPHGERGVNLLWGDGSSNWFADEGVYDNVWITNRYENNFWDLALESR